MVMTRRIDPNAIGYRTLEEALAAQAELKERKRREKAAATEQRKAARAAEAQARRDARKAEKLARAKELADAGNGGITTVARSLKPGESYVATQYKATSQVSALLNRLYVEHAQRYRSEVVRDIITGEGVIGVLITRVA